MEEREETLALVAEAEQDIRWEATVLAQPTQEVGEEAHPLLSFHQPISPLVAVVACMTKTPRELQVQAVEQETQATREPTAQEGEEGRAQ
jgi:hypothetical protein